MSNPHQFFPLQLLLATLYSNTQSQFCLLMIQWLNNRNSSDKKQYRKLYPHFILNKLQFPRVHNWFYGHLSRGFVVSILKTLTICGRKYHQVIYLYFKISLASVVIISCNLPSVVQFSSSSDIPLPISSSDDDLTVTSFEILGLRTGLFDTLMNCSKFQIY